MNKIKEHCQSVSLITLMLTAGAGNIFTALLFLVIGSTLGYYSGLFESEIE